MRFITLFVLILFFFSCNKKTRELTNTVSENNNKISITDTLTTKDPGINPHPEIEDYYTLDTINSQLITEKSFILIYPTQEELKETKELNESDFYVWKEDKEYWMSELKKIASNMNIKTITANKRKLHFITTHKNYTVDLDKDNEGSIFDFNLILFSPYKAPVFSKFVQPDEIFFKEYFDLKNSTSSED